MRASLLRLSMRTGGSQISENIGAEIAARHVIMRLCAMIGGGRPERHKDTSVFSPVAMREIVELIDSHLSVPMSLATMANVVGLSAGHVARRFHRSVGLSPNRFINKRRIGMSFAMLRSGMRPLSRIALDLGFSSQSHFTRLFSSLTGTTPQRFWRLHLQIGVR